jgi:hypothetical protein
LSAGDVRTGFAGGGGSFGGGGASGAWVTGNGLTIPDTPVTSNPTINNIVTALVVADIIPTTNSNNIVSMHPSDIVGKTPDEIGQYSVEHGLTPQGPAPNSGKGAYVDDNNTQRVLVHLNATPPHSHMNDQDGNRLNEKGNIVPNNSPEAHLPLRVN